MTGYLSPAQRERMRHEIIRYLAIDGDDVLSGRQAEKIVAWAKGGRLFTTDHDGSGVNRAYPDVLMPGPNGATLRVSVKKEDLDGPVTARAVDYLGTSEDIITARLDIGERLTGRSLATASAGFLGARVLETYNAMLTHFGWDIIAILLGVHSREFLYFECPAVPFDIDAYWWEDTGKARRGSRNIQAFPRSVSRRRQRPASSLRWNSGGHQFYVVHTIPEDAEIIEVGHVDPMTREEWEMVLATRASRAA